MCGFQKCQSLQSILKTKFVEQDTADGVKVSFKFANSVHLEYAFSPKELTKVTAALHRLHFSSFCTLMHL